MRRVRTGEPSRGFTFLTSCFCALCRLHCLTRWPVQIIDVSKSGLGLLVPLRLSPGVVVQIQSGTTFALGEVRHSRQISENKFHTGVRLQDVIAVRRPISAGPPVGDKS
jgi:hypothetical protein